MSYRIIFDRLNPDGSATLSVISINGASDNSTPVDSNAVKVIATLSAPQVLALVNSFQGTISLPADPGVILSYRPTNIFIKFNQTGTDTPVAIGAIGDSQLVSNSSGVTSAISRADVGDYTITTDANLFDAGDDTHFYSDVFCNLCSDSAAVWVKCSVASVNSISIKAYDEAGAAIDIGGHFIILINQISV